MCRQQKGTAKIAVSLLSTSFLLVVVSSRNSYKGIGPPGTDSGELVWFDEPFGKSYLDDSAASADRTCFTKGNEFRNMTRHKALEAC